MDISFSDIRARMAELNDINGHADGDFLLNPGTRDYIISRAKKDAAVLMPLIEREDGINLILTKRTDRLASHSGQIAFPGGKIDNTDASPEEAALREAWEEIGLEPHEVSVLGRLPDYHTGSGFRIAPILAKANSDADFAINRDEVDYMFEVPLSFLLNTDNHLKSKKFWNGRDRHYYEMPYQDHYIWGVTAGIIRVLYERVFVR